MLILFCFYGFLQEVSLQYYLKGFVICLVAAVVSLQPTTYLAFGYGSIDKHTDGDTPTSSFFVRSILVVAVVFSEQVDAVFPRRWNVVFLLFVVFSHLQVVLAVLARFPAPVELGDFFFWLVIFVLVFRLVVSFLL